MMTNPLHRSKPGSADGFLQFIPVSLLGHAFTGGVPQMQNSNSKSTTEPFYSQSNQSDREVRVFISPSLKLLIESVNLDKILFPERHIARFYALPSTDSKFTEYSQWNVQQGPTAIHLFTGKRVRIPGIYIPGFLQYAVGKLLGQENPVPGHEIPVGSQSLVP
jgi:hypothetical protein